MRHSTLLSMVALVVLAGCTTSVAPGGTDSPVASPDTATPSPVPTHRTPSGPCDPVDRQTVNPVREDVTPSPFPDVPPSWDRESVRAYVVDFEKAYARNAALSEISTEVTTMVSDVDVERTDRGWRVTLVSVTNTWAAGTDTGEGTPTVVHGDGARIPVQYHVFEGRLYRAEGGYDDTPGPDELGETVACFE